MTLVCFAVKEEAAAYSRRIRGSSGIKILLTGMGAANAEKAIRGAFRFALPDRVLSCGLAGGLDPRLVTGTVLFAADEDPILAANLRAAGAVPGRFHFAQSVATTAREKKELRQATGADAVEMESQVICGLCREHKVPSAVVRVILDTAAEDLPLDFNRLMTAGQKISYARLAQAIIKSPGKISALLKLQKETKAAAENLAEVLLRL
jgi:nucleoside phosphorylase